MDLKKYTLENRIIFYALDFLCANFDEGVEEDLKISHKTLEEFIEDLRKKNEVEE